MPRGVKGKIIKFVKDYHEEHGEAPSIRRILREFKRNRAALYKMFPGGKAEICKLAGVTLPEGSMRQTAKARQARKKMGGEAARGEIESAGLSERAHAEVLDVLKRLLYANALALSRLGYTWWDLAFMNQDLKATAVKFDQFPPRLEEAARLLVELSAGLGDRGLTERVLDALEYMYEGYLDEEGGLKPAEQAQRRAWMDLFKRSGTHDLALKVLGRREHK